MTNELKEKILDCLTKDVTVIVDGDDVKYVLGRDKIIELLAIIDEGIEKEIFHWKQSEMDDIAEKF